MIMVMIMIMITTNKYKIKFDNNVNVPTWDELTFEKLNSNMAFIDFDIFMEVYENDELIYSIKLKINGIYSCCGSRNFEFDIIDRQIIKDYDDIKLIHDELLNNYNNIFKDTVLNICKFRICDELCQY